MEGFESFNERAKDEKNELEGLEVHNTNLFDHNEAPGGELVDEATGKRIDNSPKVSGADEDLTELELHDDPAHTDVLPPIAEEDDAAAKWLRAQAAQLKKEKGDDFKKAA